MKSLVDTAARKLLKKLEIITIDALRYTHSNNRPPPEDYAAYEAVVAALEDYACAPGWQPFNTVPRDGRTVLVYSAMRGIRTDSSSPTGRILFYDQRAGEVYSHWMAMPPRPNTGERE